MCESIEGLEEILDQGIEGGVLLAIALDLSDGVDDRRVMFAPKTLSYLWKGGVGERLANIHGYLARLGDGPRIVAGLEVAQFEGEEARDMFLDDFDRDLRVVAVQDISQDVLGERK